MSNRLRSTVVDVCPAGARPSVSRAALAVTFSFCDAAVVTGVAVGVVCRRTDDERVLGFDAAGLARISRGASTVTVGNVRSAVCALVLEGMAESALQSTSRLALPRARRRHMG
ncbi:hypothetical protein [Bradyrhizobium sp. AZCC 2289]|uniref:hypothetical protein n=1 Tax=Bradyrhizobium sp. AZCC 2289 TaxID=3117026 RepID=UPI002FEF3063